MRVLFLDAPEGATSAHVLAALLDLGVAPSPLLAGIADLALPHDVHLEAGRVHVTPGPGEVLLSPMEVEDALHPLAADAIGRLIVDALQERALDARIDGGAIALLHATALAIDQLAPDDVRLGHIGPVTDDARALLEALSPGEEDGQSEPKWRAHPARGASRDAPIVRAALGEA